MVCDSTVYRALRKRGIRAYREEFKFILSTENKYARLKYCEDRKDWTVDDEDGLGEWIHYGFTDEMSIEIGGLMGVYIVWREADEKWHDDCVGAKKKQGTTVMCWGMIGYN